MQGENRDVQQLLAAIDTAFAAGSPNEKTDSDDKLLGMLKQLANAHPEGFFLMHGEKLAFSYHRVQYFMRSGRQEDIRRFQAELTDSEFDRLRVIQQRVATTLVDSGT